MTPRSWLRATLTLAVVGLPLVSGCGDTGGSAPAPTTGTTVDTLSTPVDKPAGDNAGAPAKP